MGDVFTKQKRSEVMSRIRGRGNKDTEVSLAKMLRMHGVTGWRRNQKLLGKPDFIFPHHRIAVFVDGCFWHFCPKHANMPASNREFWKKKLMTNRARDQFVNRKLRKLGWRVVRIWEHDLKKRPERCIEKLRHAMALGDDINQLKPE